MNLFQKFIKGILLIGETSDPSDNKEGSLWNNSTDSKIKAYINGAIRNLLTDDDVQDVSNKTIDGTSATGTNSVSTDADAVSYDNSSSLMTANDVQGAIDELDTDVDALSTDSHTHVNKALLDTYTQTEVDIADAIAKEHEHVNKALLDTYAQTEVDLADAVSLKHTHLNKAVLDLIEEALLTADKTKLNHISVSQAVDLDTMESDIATNNSKVSNATHTGDVTGDTTLSIDKSAITGKSTVVGASGDFVLVSDTSDAGNLKKVDLAGLLGGGGGTSLEILDEGSSVESDTTSIDFVGSDVQATTDGGGNVTVTLTPSGGGGSGITKKQLVDVTSAGTGTLTSDYDNELGMYFSAVFYDDSEGKYLQVSTASLDLEFGVGGADKDIDYDSSLLTFDTNDKLIITAYYPSLGSIVSEQLTDITSAGTGTLTASQNSELGMWFSAVFFDNSASKYYEISLASLNLGFTVGNTSIDYDSSGFTFDAGDKIIITANYS